MQRFNVVNVSPQEMDGDSGKKSVVGARKLKKCGVAGERDGL